MNLPRLQSIIDANAKHASDVPLETDWSGCLLSRRVRTLDPELQYTGMFPTYAGKDGLRAIAAYIDAPYDDVVALFGHEHLRGLDRKEATKRLEKYRDDPTCKPGGKKQANEFVGSAI